MIVEQESVGALKMLSSLSSLATSFGGFVGHVRQQPNVRFVTVAVEPLQSQTDMYPTLHSYVDIELDNGNHLAWHLNVWIDKDWTIDYYVSKSHEYGEIRIHVFDERTATTLEGFLSALQVSVSELITFGLDFDFSPHAEA